MFRRRLVLGACRTDNIADYLWRSKPLQKCIRWPRKVEDFAFGPAHFAFVQDPPDTLRLACCSGFGDFLIPFLFFCLQIRDGDIARGDDMKTWSIDADPDAPRIHSLAVTGATCIAASRRARLLGSGQRTLVRRARRAGSVGHRSSVAPFSVVAKCRKFWLIAAAILAPPSQGLPERSASRSILTSASHVATVFVAILAGISAARGQALQANGIVVDAPAGTYGPVTTPTNAQGGTAFNAVNGGTINATGFVTLLAAIDGARGVWTGPQGTGTVNLPFGAIVSTTGNGEAYGLQASGGGSQVTGTNVTVTTTGALNPATGFSPIGVLANGGGVVILNGGSVSTQGQGANGLRSTGVGS